MSVEQMPSSSQTPAAESIPEADLKKSFAEQSESRSSAESETELETIYDNRSESKT